MKHAKLIALVLCAVLAVSMLAGCGSAKDGDTIKIGWLGPLTGNVAQYGQAVLNGAKLYVDKLNEDGGINGKQIELITYDEEGDSTKAITGYNSLLDSGVVAIIGDVTTGPCTAVVSESQADNTPMITASATAISITYNEETGTIYKNMFRSCFIDPFQGQTMARFAANELNAKTAAVLYDNGDTYSTGIVEYFTAECASLGIELTNVESYASGAKDYSAQLTSIAAAQPDVLFLPIYYNDVALVASQAASAGITATMLGCDGWSTVLTAVTDAALVEGAYYCSGYSSQNTSTLVQNFLSDYKAVYGEDSEPGMFDAQGYDAAWILCDAIAAVEAGDTKYGTEEYGQAIIDTIAKTDGDYVTGHVTYDEYNNPQKTASIITLVNGEEQFWGSY